MHSALAALSVVSLDWQTFVHNAPAHIIAAALIVSALVQGIKKAIPGIGGWVAMLLNLAGSVTAVIVGPPVMTQDQIFTTSTLVAVITIFAGAAGIHSTVKSAVTGSTPGSSTTTNAIILALLLTGMVTMQGCHATAASGSTPSTPYQKAATIMDDIATDVLSAQQTVITLHTAGSINDQTYAALQTAFGQVATYGIQIDNLIAAQASASTIAAKIQAGAASLTTISTTAAALDPKSAAQVQQLVTALSGLFTQVLAVFTPPATTGNLSAQENYFGPRYNRSPGRAAGTAWLANLPADRSERNARQAVGGYPQRCKCQVRAGRSRLPAVVVFT